MVLFRPFSLFHVGEETGSGGADKAGNGGGNGVGEVTGEVDKQQQDGDEAEQNEEDDENSEENEDEDEYDDREGGGAVFTFIVWCDLVKLLIAALKETGSWSGKVCLLLLLFSFTLVIY